MTIQEDDYSRHLRETHVDILLSEARFKQDQQSRLEELQQRLSCASKEDLPTEESVRQSMGLPAIKQASHTNPELDKIRRNLIQTEREIIALREQREARMYRDHPGLCEDVVRKQMGLRRIV